MSGTDTPGGASNRRPAVFDPGDPTLVTTAPAPPAFPGAPASVSTDAPAPTGGMKPAPTLLRQGFRWGVMLASAATALATLALGLWFVRFVSVAVSRDDWIGWVASGLLAMCGLAAIMLVLREVIGILRLQRSGRLRQQAEAALVSRNIKAERAATRALRLSFASRPELSWHLARFQEHEGDVHDAGALLRLAEREILAPLDAQARRVVALSVKRVAMITAISPTAVITVGALGFETLRLLRRLATIYGGRPGFLGTMRLASAAVGNIVAAGVVDFTTDFVGQFIGQDLMRRLSTRLGEGVFNGALTARIGATAIDIIRPLPFIEMRPIKARDFLGDLWRLARAGAAPAKDGVDDKASPPDARRVPGPSGLR